VKVRDVEPLTPAVLYELFERSSQCVLDQKGKCPLLFFSEEFCWQVNQYFLGAKCETQVAAGRMQYPRTGLAHEELE
jgi:hypothetical protein